MKRLLFLSFLCAALNASAQVPDYVPTDGLVAWYPFNGNANDESSFANHGIVVGATLTTDRFGLPNSAYNFDGNDHIEAPHQDWLNTGTGSKTWAGWGRKTSGNDHAHFLTKIVVTSSPYSAINMYLRYAPSEGIEFSEGQTGAGGNGVAIQSNSLLNQWVHLTGIKDADNGTIRIYQNGTLMSEATMQSPHLSFDNSGPLFIGCEHPYISLPSGPQYFFGDLDDLGIWNRALSESEVTALFTGIAPVPGCTDETACNYDADANVDDGSCIPSGCIEEGACNYNADAQCEGEACDYSCCPGPGCCGEGMHWDAAAQTCVITPPSVAPDAECTLFNLQELAEGYQILLAQNAELDSLLADCNGTSTSDQSGPCSGEDVVTYHGYDYNIIEIGNQCWFAENLRTDFYRNGEVIASDLSADAWQTTQAGALAVYSGDLSNVNNLGLLYNWHTVGDGRGICPTEWHVPLDDEWFLMEEHILSCLPNDSIGLQLKSSSGWTDNGNGLDTYGFNAKPAGFRSSETGEYNYLNSYTYFWSSSMSSNNSAFVRRLDYFSDEFRRYSGNENLNQGFSVRCVKD